MKGSRAIILPGVAIGLLVCGCSEPPTTFHAPDPEYPTALVDVAYGPDQRNVLDLWRADSTDPTPLAIFIHGGGFIGGSKENLDVAERDALLAAGVSVVSINYRLATTDPMPAQHLDVARVLQFLRTKAVEWGFDPTSVCVWGTSGGGALSMWLGTHDDLADPDAVDPVGRESTRVTCAVPIEGQSTFDREWIQEWIGGNLHMHPNFPLWFGVESHEDLETPEVQAVMDEVSSLLHASAGDAPMYMVYHTPNVPLPEDANPRDGAHHPIFGIKLAEVLESFGVETTVVIQDRAEGGDPYGSLIEFIKAKLGVWGVDGSNHAEASPGRPSGGMSG